MNLNRYAVKGKDGRTAILRPAEETDAPFILQAVEEIIRSGVFIQKEQKRTLDKEKEFIREMKEKGNLYAVVELDGKAAGIARVIKGELAMKRHTGLYRTWLSERASGVGFGREILNYTLDWCRNERLHKLCLTVFASNEIAVRLYEKNGFVIEGIQKEQVLLNGRFDDEIYMARFFNKQNKNAVL
ncbi:GNAT family N-acetyltransferase [Metabacillus sp. GX 13764]|uniref:GNAT family N-acetyltransferase n=1 Tax=Metabacillus kandeliae TaxID=2900151 RepID=UPI001E5B4051|nr:GNAT family protein [Metabacillus kandeliae]MCD7033426.1 GNAT family N-acetyltransferase [Metabacillus kandeliae]